MEQNEMEEAQLCEWCGNEIDESKVTEHDFLTAVLGYGYCSQQCMEDHINSK